MFKGSYLIYSNCGRKIIKKHLWGFGYGISQYLDCDNILQDYLYFIQTGDIPPNLCLSNLKTIFSPPDNIYKLKLVCWSSPGVSYRRRTITIKILADYQA